MALAQSGRRSKRIHDAELDLVVSKTVTSVGANAETAINFEARKLEEYKAVVAVTAFDFTTTDETYVVTVEVSDLVGGTFTIVGTLTVVATGIYEIPLSGTWVEQLDADADWVRVNATLGGTTPSLTYQAYLTAA